MSWLIMVEYDEDNRPKEYVVAGTPGEPTIPAGPMLNYVGLVGKYVLGCRYGYDFIEIDMWNDSEALEPKIKSKFKRIKETQGIDCGMHLKIHLDLTTALAEKYINDHQSLLIGIQAAALLADARFILIHSASSIVPEFTDSGKRTESGSLVTPWGGNLGEFIRNPLKFDKSAGKIFAGLVNNQGDVKTNMRPLDGNKGVYWNIFGEVKCNNREVTIEALEGFDEICENNKGSPTFLDWVVAKYMTPFWSPVGTVEDATSKVELKKYATMHHLYNQVYDKHIRGLREKTDKAYEDAKVLMDEENKKFEDENASEEIKQESASKLSVYIPCIDKIEEHKSIEKHEFNKIFKDASGYNVFQRVNALHEYFDSILGVVREITDKIQNLPQHLSKLSGELVKPFIDLINSFHEFNNNYEGLVHQHSGIISNVRKAYTANYNHWETSGSPLEEKMAYHVIAKWMYIIKDPLYEYIVAEKYAGSNEDEEAMDGEVHRYLEWLKREYTDDNWWAKTFGNGIKTKEDMTYDLFIDPDNMIKLSEAFNGENHIGIKKMVSAVAGKYIQGHFDAKMRAVDNIDMELSPGEQKKYISETKKNPNIAAQEEIFRKLAGDGKMLCVYEYLYKSHIHFYIETQTKLQDGMEGKVKLMRIIDHINIIRSFNKHYGFRNVSYTLDFEHLTLNLLNPEEQIAMLREGDGKYVSMVHINPPSSHDGLHKMLGVLTEDIEKVYRWVWMLKEKGMDNAYFVWEMGKDSNGNFEAPGAVRKIKHFLTEKQKDGSKGVPYNKLYTRSDFFGIDKNFEASQNAAITAHALDPLKDMFVLPEPDHTFIGGHLAGQKAGIIDKEKYR